MIYKQIIYIILVAISVFSTGNGRLFAQQPAGQRDSVAIRYTNATVEAAYSTDTIMIGDQVTLQVIVNKDVSDEVAFPTFSDKPELAPGFEVLSEGKIDTMKKENSRVITLKRDYKITVFNAGIYQNPIAVLVGNRRGVDTVFSNPADLVVNTYAIDTTTQKIYDVKAPLAAPLQFAEIDIYVYIGLLLLALIALAIFLIRRYRKHKSLFARPKLPPHVIAVNELLKIKEQNLWQEGHYKEYYTELTDTLREYIDGRFGHSAMEMTTEEIMLAVKEDAIEEKDRVTLRELLSLSDLVKFAKYTPDAEDNVKSLEVAFAFVEHTKREDLPTEVEMVDPSKAESVTNEPETDEHKSDSNDKPEREEERV